MFVDFSKTAHPAPSLSCTLYSVYRVHAAPQYHVRHERLPGMTILVYTFAGGGRLLCRGIREELAAGTLLLFSPQNDVFEYYTTQEEWRFWWFEFAADTLPAEEGKPCRAALEQPLIAEMQEILLLHRQECYAFASTRFSGLLAEISRQLELQSADGRRLRLLQELETDVQEHLAQVTVQSLCARAGLCDKTVRALFWEYTGQLPKQYITMKKMQTAQYSLRTSSTSVAQLSAELGYSSPFHFCKAFRQYAHMTPTEYREGTQQSSR